MHAAHMDSSSPFPSAPTMPLLGPLPAPPKPLQAMQTSSPLLPPPPPHRFTALSTASTSASAADPTSAPYVPVAMWPADGRSAHSTALAAASAGQRGDCAFPGLLQQASLAVSETGMREHGGLLLRRAARCKGAGGRLEGRTSLRGRKARQGPKKPSRQPTSRLVAAPHLLQRSSDLAHSGARPSGVHCQLRAER